MAMNRHIRTSVVRLALIAALCCSLCLALGCNYVTMCLRGYVTWSSAGSGGDGEPGTKYFVLLGPPLGFQASPWGLGPELGVPWGTFSGVPLEQFEINFRDLKRCPPGDVAAVKHVDGRCAEVAQYYRGVVRWRCTFEHDAAGRARRRIDTLYEGRREGEGDKEWADRFKGGTPPVACVSEIEYAWSKDGRTVEVTLRGVHGKPQGWPMYLLGPAGGEPGQRLETWQLNGQGFITSVLRDGKVVYSAQYDDAGRLLCCETEEQEKLENRYDAQGRILETHVRYRGGTRGTLVHQYPGGPKAEMPHLKEPGDQAWVVTHDKYGRVSRLREHAGPPDDLMCNTFDEFRRDKDGRIIWRRVGFAR